MAKKGIPFKVDCQVDGGIWQHYKVLKEKTSHFCSHKTHLNGNFKIYHI